MYLLEIPCFCVGKLKYTKPLHVNPTQSRATPSAWRPKQPDAQPAHSERPGRISSRQTSRPTRPQQRLDGAPNTSGEELTKNESDPHDISIRIKRAQTTRSNQYITPQSS